MKSEPVAEKETEEENTAKAEMEESISSAEKVMEKAEDVKHEIEDFAEEVEN